MAPSGIGSSVRSLSLRVLVASMVCAVAALSPFLPGGPAAASAQVERGAHKVAGYSLSFNGADAYVSSADSPSLRIERANAFTVAFWVYLRRIDNNALPRFWEKGGAFLCVMGDTSNPRFGTIGLEVANASGTGNANGGASEFWGKTRLHLDQWYFVAVTFAGNRSSSQAQIYLDGSPEKMTNVYTWSGRLGSTVGETWFIGRRAKDLSRGLDGQLDSMVVYQAALNAAQIRQLYRGAAPNGRSADWEFDEGSGAITADHSGNQNDGAITNAVFAPR